MGSSIIYCHKPSETAPMWRIIWQENKMEKLRWKKQIREFFFKTKTSHSTCMQFIPPTYFSSWRRTPRPILLWSIDYSEVSWRPWRPTSTWSPRRRPFAATALSGLAFYSNRNGTSLRRGNRVHVPPAQNAWINYTRATAVGSQFSHAHRLPVVCKIRIIHVPPHRRLSLLPVRIGKVLHVAPMASRTCSDWASASRQK